MNINLKSVFISGFVAGLIIIVSGLGMIPLVGNQMNEVLESRSLPSLSNGAMGYFGIMSIVLGIFIVWIYAFVQSNFKSKLKVAVTVSVIIWFLTYFWSNAALVAYGFMPFRLAAIGTAYGLLELILASIVGSKLYKEVKQK
ncbi:hypothetical protein KAR48_10175 [bacterium]|nr:hypothetical protein [bacterium]